MSCSRRFAIYIVCFVEMMSKDKEAFCVMDAVTLICVVIIPSHFIKFSFSKS